jgi:hypothetical protein
MRHLDELGLHPDHFGKVVDFPERIEFFGGRLGVSEEGEENAGEDSKSDDG